MKLNIYEFDFGAESDWVIASSKKRAKELHQSETEMDDDDYSDDNCNISLVLKKDWKNQTYLSEEKDPVTFKEYMESDPEEEIFCSTAY
jgi:hypothetical protein